MATSWRKLKTAYVTGTDSYRQLAARHGISVSTLSKVAKKEGWAEARRQYGDKVEAKTVAAMCARACAREVKHLEKLQRAAESLADRMGEVLADDKQFYRHIVTEGRGGGVYGATVKVFKKADIKAMKDYAAALNSLTQAMRDLHRLPGAMDQHAMEMAAARLAVEQAKLALQDGTGDEGNETGVVEMPGVLPIGEADAVGGMEGDTNADGTAGSEAADSDGGEATE